MKIFQTITELWGVHEYLEKIIKGHNLEATKGEQSYLRTAHRLYPIHIPIKLHEDIINSVLFRECTRM